MGGRVKVERTRVQGGPSSPEPKCMFCGRLAPNQPQVR